MNGAQSFYMVGWTCVDMVCFIEGQEIDGPPNINEYRISEWPLPESNKCHAYVKHTSSSCICW